MGAARGKEGAESFSRTGSYDCSAKIGINIDSEEIVRGKEGGGKFKK